MSLDRVGGRYSYPAPQEEPKKKRRQEEQAERPKPRTVELPKRDPVVETPKEPKRVSIDTSQPPKRMTEEQPEPSEEPKRARKIPLSKKEDKVDEERLGTWADTGYHASDAEAHRDVRYKGASPVGRILGVFMTQMKLFAKGKWMFVMMFAAVLIPIVMMLLPSDILDALMAQCGISTKYIGLILCFMPLMISFFTAVLCGTQLPNEFKDRTAYMSIPLPVSRTEFYIGKYLAGFVLCLGVFLMAFGFAVLMGMMEYDEFFSDMIGRALVYTVVAIFAYSATAYCIGTFMRRGSALVPLMLMFIILPAVFLYLGLKFEIDWVFNMPCFLPDAILASLGSPMTLSLLGMFSLVGGGSYFDDMGLMVLIGVAWGVLFLVIGALKMNRREM